MSDEEQIETRELIEEIVNEDPVQEESSFGFNVPFHVWAPSLDFERRSKFQRQILNRDFRIHGSSFKPAGQVSDPSLLRGPG